MRTIIKYFSALATLSLAVVGILTVAGVIDLNALMDMLGNGGAILAVAGSAAVIAETPIDTTKTSSASSELLMSDISQAITIMRPDLYPLDTMLRRVGSAETIKSWEFEWYETDYRGWADTLASPFDTSSSGTYNSNNKVHTLTVTNIHFWVINDTFMIPAYDDTENDGPIQGIVVSKNSSTNSIGVVIVGGGDLPDMASGTKIIRMAPAKSELDAQTAQYGVMPQKESNYVQIHMKQVEEGIYQRYHKKEVNWTMNDLKAAAMEDHRRGAEFTSIFGKKGKTYDPEVENYKYTTNGLIRYISKSIDYTESPTNSNTEFLRITKSIFTGNAGSKTRYVFGGSEFMEWLASVDSVSRQRDAGSVKEQFGITFDRIQTNYGTLMVLYHQLLDDWDPQKAMVLDMNNVYRKEFKNLGLRQVDLIKSGQRLTNATVIEEIFGLEIRYPLTHAILTPASS
ncbi:MAG: DUF5309 family protein [Bacteroidales bacterium]|jgi:hypothetical protein|nr:DUF5309 family protein [Bacteroidales bacterium]